MLKWTGGDLNPAKMEISPTKPFFYLNLPLSRRSFRFQFKFFSGIQQEKKQGWIPDVKSAKILDIDAFDSETENENAVMLLCRNLNVKAIVAQQLTEKRKCL